jgi:RNA polymerase sigma-70 factor (ECF subfamily)
MIRDPDFDLVKRCQSEEGETAEAAYEELFDAYRDRVFNLAGRLLGNTSDAEDVAQEAFVTVFRKIREFRFSSRFYTWLYRVVYNLCIDHKRRTGIAGVVPGPVAEDGTDALPAFPDPALGPLESLAAGEYVQQSVERALARLSQPLRAVVLLRYMEDLQYQEIAEVLGCSVGTVKSRLSRAHSFLQETLRPH